MIVILDFQAFVLNLWHRFQMSVLDENFRKFHSLLIIDILNDFLDVFDLRLIYQQRSEPVGASVLTFKHCKWIFYHGRKFKTHILIIFVIHLNMYHFKWVIKIIRKPKHRLLVHAIHCLNLNNNLFISVLLWYFQVCW